MLHFYGAEARDYEENYNGPEQSKPWTNLFVAIKVEPIDWVCKNIEPILYIFDGHFYF